MLKNHKKDMTMKELMEKESLFSLFNPPAFNDVVKGRIMGKQKSAMFVDLGIFGSGIVSGREFLKIKHAAKDLNIGDEVSAKVVETDNDDGYIELSMSSAQEESSWQVLKEKKLSGKMFPITIIKANKGGLMATLDGVVGFLPVSQLKPENYPKVEDGDQAKILQRLQKFIGQEIKVYVLTVDPKQKALVFSEKGLNHEKTQELLSQYKIGDIVEGRITGVVEFGAFIRFPLTGNGSDEKTIEGLIHISEMDWQLIQNPGDIVKVGDVVKVKITDISGGRVSLSLRALKPDPWEKLDEKYLKGMIVEGAVTKINPFGAFVEIEPKIQGLIHISEFENGDKMNQSLEIGKNYQFTVSVIEPKEHRMILTLVKNGQKTE